MTFLDIHKPYLQLRTKISIYKKTNKNCYKVKKPNKSKISHSKQQLCADNLPVAWLVMMVLETLEGTTATSCWLNIVIPIM